MIAVMKHHDQKQLGEESVYSFSLFIRIIRTGTEKQSRNLYAKGEREAMGSVAY